MMLLPQHPVQMGLQEEHAAAPAVIDSFGLALSSWSCGARTGPRALFSQLTLSSEQSIKTGLAFRQHCETWGLQTLL